MVGLSRGRIKLDTYYWMNFGCIKKGGDKQDIYLWMDLCWIEAGINWSDIFGWILFDCNLGDIPLFLPPMICGSLTHILVIIENSYFYKNQNESKLCSFNTTHTN